VYCFSIQPNRYQRYLLIIPGMARTSIAPAVAVINDGINPLLSIEKNSKDSLPGMPQNPKKQVNQHITLPLHDQRSQPTGHQANQ
jgi:hypothetical protein